MTADRRQCGGTDLLQRSGLQLVCLCHYHRPGNGTGIKKLHDLGISAANPAAAIDQKKDSLQRGAASKKFAGQRCPGLDIGLRRRRIAIAWKIDKLQPAGEIEKNQLARATRCL